MASTKISALPAASTLTGAETIPLVQGGVTKKVTTDQFLTAANPSYTGTLTGGTGVVNLGSGQFYKDASGNVGLGTVSPTQRLTVEGRGIFSVADAVYATAFNATSGNFRVIPYLDSTSGTALTAYSAGYAGNPPSRKMTFDASSMRFCTGGTERARIDASGNLGVGVTPSAWDAGGGGIEFWNAGTTVVGKFDASLQPGRAAGHHSPTTKIDVQLFRSVRHPSIAAVAQGKVGLCTPAQAAQLLRPLEMRLRLLAHTAGTTAMV
jgi:hypothetical protein